MQQQGLKLTFKKSTHPTSTKSKSAKGRSTSCIVLYMHICYLMSLLWDISTQLFQPKVETLKSQKR